MKVKELIELLNKIENKDQIVEIGIHQYNEAYPIAYTEPMKTDYLNQAWDRVRIWTWLPDGMYTVQRKKGK